MIIKAVQHSKLRTSKGFTLIELLIVIGILGVLAAALLTVLDPLEQLARGRDAGRESTIDQLGHAMSSYFVANNNVYPTVNNTWQASLQTSGEMKSLATNPAYSKGLTPGCAGGAGNQNNYCYFTNNTDAVVYAQGESKSFEQKASGGVGAPCAAARTWIVWDSVDSKTGVLCNNGAPTAGTSYTLY